MTVVDVERARLKSLLEQRTALEAEMNDIIARLTAPGGAGLTQSLVDKEVRSHSCHLD